VELLGWEWQGTVAHPRAFASVLKRTITKRGYGIKGDFYKEEPAVLKDTAYFQGKLSGRQDVEMFVGWKAAAIVLLCLLVPIVGWLALCRLGRTGSKYIDIGFEGELYSSAGRDERVERAAVTSDIRLKLGAGLSLDDGKWIPKTLVAPHRDAATQDAYEIVSTLAEELPKMVLPEIQK
jgi:hypothetical protein